MLDLLTIPDPFTSINVPDIFARATHQGRTSSGRFTTPSLLEFVSGDEFPPDSLFWRRQANASLEYLRKRIPDTYTAWAELTWPGQSIDKLTWRTIREMTEAAIETCEARETSPETLAEAAHARLEKLIKEKTHANSN